MSQFHGYTVDVVFRDPPGKVVRGAISSVSQGQIVLENPALGDGNGNYERMETRSLVVVTAELEDLNVVELAKNEKSLGKGKKKNKKDGDANGSNGGGNRKKDKREKGRDREREREQTPSSSGTSTTEKSLETKFVDVYNEKPSSGDNDGNNKKKLQLEEFDFESNLQKFDKESVFKDIQKNDTTDQSDRLVSFNKLEKKDKYANDEMVLKRKDESEDKWNDATYNYSDLINSSKKLSAHGLDSAVETDNSVIATGKPGTSFERKPSLVSTPTFAQFFSSKYEESPVPTCSTLQLSDVFNTCISKFGVSKDILIENSGRSICELIINNIIGPFRISFKNHNEPPVLLLLVGNNRAGSVALASGRHLLNRGLKTVAFLLYDSENSTDELLDEVDTGLKVYSDFGGKIVTSIPQLKDLLKSMDTSIEFIVEGLHGFDSDLSDLLDTELHHVAQLINWCNDTGLPILSIDIPAGLNASSGTNENEPVICDVLKSKYVASVGLPLSATLNMYKFGYFEKGKVVHYIIDTGIPRGVYGSKGSLRKFDRRWFAESGFVDLAVV